MAVYSHPTYLASAAAIIREFNHKGLIITPYLYSTIVAVAAALKIQVGRRRGSKIQRSSSACLPAAGVEDGGLGGARPPKPRPGMRWGLGLGR